MTIPDEFGDASQEAPDLARRALPARPSRTPVVVAAVAGVLALAAVGVFVVPQLLPPPSASAPLSPEQTVAGFFDALVAADAAAALAFVWTPPADAAFLTDDVLREMRAAHPITGVSPSLTEATDDTAVVAVAYAAGGQPENAEFDLVFAEGRWRLDAGAVTVDLDEVVGPAAGLRIFGVDVGDKTEVALFPGVYDISTGDPLLTLGAKTMSAAGSTGADDVEVGLSKAGVAKVRDAAKKKLSACAAPGKMPPDSCDIAPGKPANGEIAPKSIEWEVASGASGIDRMTPSLLPGNKLAGAPVSVRLNLSAESTDKKWHYATSRTITTVQADLSDPKNIQITFTAADE